MPSGARKRKAAKKKKELEANHSHDQEDAKSQDDKGSDGSGEVSSPVHQDHNNTQHHPPGGVIEIQWSLKDEGASSSTSSRSSSDDEKKPEKEEEAPPIRAVDEKESSGSLVAEVSPVIEAVKPVEVPVSEETTGSRSSKDDEKKPEKEEEGPPIQAVDEKESSRSLVAEVSPVIEAVKPVEVPVSEETISYLETAPVDNLLVNEVIKSDTSVVPETSAGFSLSEPKSGYDSKGYEDNRTVASSENQIPVPLVANEMKKTSVFSCCGIFEVFSASSR